MEEYTIGFPPEMNKEDYRMTYDESKGVIGIPLEGEFKKKRSKKKDNNEMTH